MSGRGLIMERCVWSLQSVIRKYRAIDADIRRYRWNWAVMFMIISLVGGSYFILIPSLHQFVTSSATPSDPTIEPGLGLSELWYSWIISIASIGELLGAIVSGLLTNWLYSKHLMLVSLFLCCAGGVVYGVGRYGWMLLLARFLIGLFQGSFNVILRSYIGETSEKMISMLPVDKQAKSTIKYSGYFTAFIVGNTSMALSPALSAIANHIPGLDQFRWSGWYVSIYSGLLFIIVVVRFHDKKSDRASSGSSKCAGCKPLYSHIGIFLFLLLSFGVTNTFFAILETQENPILSDNFGLDIRYSAYIISGSIAMYPIGTVLVYGLQRCHIDNRLIAIIGAVVGVAGATVLGDWQVLGGDPCNQFSNTTLPSDDITSSSVLLVHNGSCHHSQQSLSLSGQLISCQLTCMDQQCMLLERLSSELLVDDMLCVIIEPDQTVHCLWSALHITFNPTEGSGDIDQSLDPLLPNGINCSDSISNLVTNMTGVVFIAQPLPSLNTTCPPPWDSNVNLSSCDSNTNHTTTSECVCQAYSSVPGYSCFWNQISRVTGERCERCPPVCLSKTHSLHFAQLIIGLLLFTPGFPIGRLTITLILSDIIGRAPQGLLMSMLVATGSVARITGPLWGNQVYLLADRRTWLLMLILTVMQLVVVIGFVLLYRKMAPNKDYSTAAESKEEDRVELLSFTDETARADDDNTLDLNVDQSMEDEMGSLDEQALVTPLTDVS